MPRTIVDNYSLVVVSKNSETANIVSPDWSFAEKTFDGRLVVKGQIYHAPNSNIPDGSDFTSEPISCWNNGWFKVEHGRIDETYYLGEPHPDYKKFLNAVKKDLPIIYFWESGFNISGQRYLAGLKLNKEHECLEHFCKIVVSQDLITETLTFADASEAFVDWGSWSNYEKLKFVIFSEKFRDSRFASYGKVPHLYF